jgi:hypothetical protein
LPQNDLGDHAGQLRFFGILAGLVSFRNPVYNQAENRPVKEEKRMKQIILLEDSTRRKAEKRRKTP